MVSGCYAVMPMEYRRLIKSFTLLVRRLELARLDCLERYQLVGLVHLLRPWYASFSPRSALNDAR